MNKKELVDYVAATNNLTKKVAEEVVTGVFSKVVAELASGNEVVIHGFGTFGIKTNAARTLRPFGGKEIKTEESKGVKFSASKALKDEMNK